MTPEPSRPSLPPEIAYYRLHLLAGRFRALPLRAVPAPSETRSRHDQALRLPKAALLRAPDSPAFREVLLASREPFVSGWLIPGLGRHPVLVLKDHGAWVLRPPSRGRSFDRLRELDRPEHLLPVRFTRIERDGVARHLHTIPLRWHPHGHLSLEVRLFPSGSVSYDAWVWLPGHRRMIALYWEEKERVVQLFRDLTASYFRCAPPQAASAVVGEPPEEPDDAAPITAAS
ncbi:MAG: hypothetical protein HY705_08855 [Gemmatimonadetes bacterium]|nr:hypothetical protein [Gemmatimonadota bacterium]